MITTNARRAVDLNAVRITVNDERYATQRNAMQRPRNSPQRSQSQQKIEQTLSRKGMKGINGY
jgi:hypothetical protein